MTLCWFRFMWMTSPFVVLLLLLFLGFQILWARSLRWAWSESSTSYLGSKPRRPKIGHLFTKASKPRMSWMYGKWIVSHLLKWFWCLMINITFGLMCLLVFMFIVPMMQSGLGLRHWGRNMSKKTLEDSWKTCKHQAKSKTQDNKSPSEETWRIEDIIVSRCIGPFGGSPNQGARPNT
jgi:hypothetical protein